MKIEKFKTSGKTAYRTPSLRSYEMSTSVVLCASPEANELDDLDGEALE